jgi:hypothetical protein
MIRRLLVVAALAASLVFAQPMRMTAAQLKAFLRSSITLKHPDKQVANYLKNVQLTEKLSDDDVEQLAAEGLGPRATEALRGMARTAVSRPAAAAPAPRAPALPPIPPPDSQTQARVINEAREMGLEYTKRLPDFICLQVTRRYVDPSGLEMYQLADTVAERLSYFEQKEDYKLVSVNGAASTLDREKIGGATSSGEFGTMLRDIFMPSTRARFEWQRWAKLRGKICHVYSYQVEQSRSQWHIIWEKQSEIVPGYRGLLYVDRDVPTVLRVTLEAIDIPASFPIQEASTMLDYDYTSISNSQYLLPLRSEMKMREGRMLVKNQTEFRSYRKFGAEATITFDTAAEPLSDDKFKEEKPVPTPPAKP